MRDDLISQHYVSLDLSLRECNFRYSLVTCSIFIVYLGFNLYSLVGDRLFRTTCGIADVPGNLLEVWNHSAIRVREPT